jgi:hypothetical protein
MTLPGWVLQLEVAVVRCLLISSARRDLIASGLLPTLRLELPTATWASKYGQMPLRPLQIVANPVSIDT